MKQSEQKNRRLLTGLNADLRVAIPERRHDEAAREGKFLSGFDGNDFPIHSRDMYVLQLQPLRNAGVFHGISSDANSESRQPTRHQARWVFSFPGDSLIPEHGERFCDGGAIAALFARSPERGN